MVINARITKGLDDIFHFKTLVFNLIKDELTFVPAYSLGQVQLLVDKEYKITPEIEQRLQKSNVFSPAELDHKLSAPEMTNGELPQRPADENHQRPGPQFGRKTGQAGGLA